MPLSPIPIIIGTTMAVIGGGYAFKKFVYDPHLAPFIEAIIASHQSSSPYNRQPIPVPVSSTPAYAATSSRRDRTSELRRRRRSNEDDMREGLLRSLSRDDESYELRDTPEPLPRSAVRPLIHLDDAAPSSPQDAEIREIIFNQPATPARSGSATPLLDTTSHAVLLPPAVPAHQAHNPFAIMAPITLARPPAALRSPPPAALDLLPASTSFSFLSLSQTSSPEASHAILQSLGSLNEHWEEVNRATSAREREDDAMSMPETASTGDDFEVFSAVSSPQAAARAQPGPVRSPSRQTAILGMEVLEPEVQRHRGPMSVVSLSESEGWGGESDWDARSDAAL